MATLYDIRENLRWLQYLAETAELTEEQEMELDQVELNREVLLEEYVKIIKNLEADTRSYADASREFLKKKHRAEKNIEYLRKQVIADLLDHGDLKKRVGHFTVGTARTPGKIVVHNEEALPAKFKKIKQEVSKSAIQEHIKETGEIPVGVDFERGIRLSIR